MCSTLNNKNIIVGKYRRREREIIMCENFHESFNYLNLINKRAPGRRRPRTTEYPFHLSSNGDIKNYNLVEFRRDVGKFCENGENFEIVQIFIKRKHPADICREALVCNSLCFYLFVAKRLRSRLKTF